MRKLQTLFIKIVWNAFKPGVYFPVGVTGVLAQKTIIGYVNSMTVTQCVDVFLV